MTIDVLDLRTFPPVEPLSTIPETYRQTLLSKVTECPRSAYLYSKYDGGALTHPLAGGTVLHRAIELFIREILEEGEMQGVPERAKDILNQVLVESTDLTVGPDRFDSMRAMMHHLAEALVLPAPDSKAKVVCLETPVTVELNGRLITGTIDFAEVDDNEVRIRDWKSAFYNVSRATETEDEDEYVPTKEEWPGTFQLILYAYALATGSIEGVGDEDMRKVFGSVGTFSLRQDHPRRFWKSEGTIAYREAVIDRDTLLDWRLYLEAAVAKLDNAFETWDFPAVMGKHCAFCPSSGECPIPAAPRAYAGEIRTDEDAARAALMWQRHGERRDEYWSRLKDYMKRRGGRLRFGRDLELFFKKSEGERLKRSVDVEGRKMDTKEEFKAAIARRNAGQPGEIDWETYYEKSISTRLSKRVLTDAELADEKRKGTIT